MGIIDFLKKVFSEPEPVVQETIKVEFEEIEQELEKTLETTDEIINRVKQQVSEKVKSLVQELKTKLQVLDNIDLEKRKEQEKIKLIVKENLNLYSSYVFKLVADLEKLELNHEYLEKLKMLIESFKAKSSMSFEKATILVGKELGNIKSTLINFSLDFNNTIAENKKLFEKIKTIKDSRITLEKINQENILGKKIKEELEKLKNSQKSTEEIIETKKEEIEKIKNSEDYKKIQEELESFRNNQEKMEQEISRLKDELDLKFLSKHFHAEEKKSKLIKNFIENFKTCLKNNSSELTNLVKEVRQDYDVEKIINLTNKLKNMQEWKEKPLEIELKDKEHQTKTLRTEIIELASRLELENKKFSKLQEKIANLKTDLKEKIKILNLELNP